MGGHVSKAHPGQSLSYKNKLEVRSRRTKLRELNIKAKKIVKKSDPKAFQAKDKTYFTMLKLIKEDLSTKASDKKKLNLRRKQTIWNDMDYD